MSFRSITLAVLLMLGGEAAAADRGPTDEGRKVETLYDEWRFGDADLALKDLQKNRAGTAEMLYLEGYERFLSGDYTAAVAKLKAAAGLAPNDRDIGGLLALAEAAGSAIKGHEERRSQHFVLRFPPEDAVIAEWALEALESALGALREDLGFTVVRPIPVDIYRSPQDLAAVSTLTVEEVERTGTIALCKWARLMATSPRALRYGYPWLDSLSHELVHYVVSSLSNDRTPVWLQEGLAKFLERRWREPPGGPLPPSMQHLLAKALQSGKLITFEQMHPSMAKLPRAEDAGLAFAEVATAVAHLHQRGGAEALRQAIVRVAAGVDARTAVAQAAGVPWKEFEKDWKAYMHAQKYRTFPDFEPVTRKFRKSGAVASKRAPTEDEAALGVDKSEKHLRLGNMLLMRHRPRAAAMEYEKGSKAAGSSGHWVFAVKLGRTYLALGDADKALAAVAPARELYPELPWPHLISGQAWLAKGDVQSAATALEMSLATNPFDPAVHCGLADAYDRLGGRPGTTSLPARRERTRKACQDMNR